MLISIEMSETSTSHRVLTGHSHYFSVIKNNELDQHAWTRRKVHCMLWYVLKQIAESCLPADPFGRRIKTVGKAVSRMRSLDLISRIRRALGLGYFIPRDKRPHGLCGVYHFIKGNLLSLSQAWWVLFALLKHVAMTSKHTPAFSISDSTGVGLGSFLSIADGGRKEKDK